MMTFSYHYLYIIVSIGSLLLSSHAYTITTESNASQPKPGDNLFYDIKLGPTDTVTIVDIHLANGSRGNSSLIFGSSDLSKPNDANAGFPIPFVPPGSAYTIRILDASNKVRLADSATFQIFAAGASSPSSIPPTFLPSPVPTSIPSQSPTSSPGATDPQPSSSKKSTPIGPIIGGVLGGLLAIVLVLLALLLVGRRKKKRLSYYETNNKPRPITPPANGDVKPFMVRPPEPVSPDIVSATDISTAGLTTNNSRTTMSEKARLAQSQARSRSTRDVSSLSPTTASTSSPALPSSRADELRVERDRLNRMIADLENRTVSSPSTTAGVSTYTFASSSNQSGVSSGDSRDHHLAEQVAALREQIQRMEARQAQQSSPQQFSSATSNAGFSDYEPPPIYEPPPSSTIGPAVAGPNVPTTRPSDLDRKTPLDA